MPPQRPNAKRPPLKLVAVALILVLGLLKLGSLAISPREPFTDQRAAEVVRVVDGDTIIVRGVDGRNERVRLLGIDAPETAKENQPLDEPFAQQATEFVNMLVAGKTVMLSFDRRRKDKYDRTLAYVYVGELLVNEAIVFEGLARVYTFTGDSAVMAERFRAAEQAARAAGRGIWSQPEKAVR